MKFGVVGGGQMGNGIAQVASASGFSVVMMDVSSESVNKGLATIQASCDRLIKKEKMTAAQKSRTPWSHHDVDRDGRLERLRFRR